MVLLSQELPFDRVLAEPNPLLGAMLDEQLDLHIDKFAMLQYLITRLFAGIAKCRLHCERPNTFARLYPSPTDSTYERTSCLLYTSDAADDTP